MSDGDSVSTQLHVEEVIVGSELPVIVRNAS